MKMYNIGGGETHLRNNSENKDNSWKTQEDLRVNRLR